MEGGVGPYWGLLDASRHAKFSWTGPITDPDYFKHAGLAVLLGLLLSLPILAMSGVTVAQALTLATSANLVGAWCTAIVAFWTSRYFVPGAAFALGLGIVLLIPLVAIAFARIEEIAAVAFGRPSAPAGGRRRRSCRRLLRRKSRSTFRPIASSRTCSRPRSMPSRGWNIRISNACW